MTTRTLFLLIALACSAITGHAVALDKTECIAGAKPGGGFELTCQLAQAGLAQGKHLTAPMQIRHLPGGIGAVAYTTVVTQRPADAQALVAFSSGSLLNLAQGKFGPFGARDVRWVAAVAADYGVIVVARDAPYKTLKDFMAALKADPSKVVFGAGGAVGGQDWVKAALTAQAAGVHQRNMRVVAFEGGGEALTALQGGHVQVYTGDASETVTRIAAGAPLRVLAVMSAERLPGRLAAVPTARESGYALDWPIVRGFYVGPQVSDADYRQWTEIFDRLLARDDYARLRDGLGLFKFALTGEALDHYVQRSMLDYRKLAQDLGLTLAR